jgi:hypothetical protein
MTDLQTLIDERDIRVLLEGYARTADRIDVEAKIGLYHEDGYDDHGFWQGLGSEWSNNAANPDLYAARWRLFGNHQVELDGDVAYSELYVLMVSRKPPGVDDPHHIAVLGARFLDTLDRVDGKWKISYRRFVVDWQTVWDNDKPYVLGPDKHVTYDSMEYFLRGGTAPDDRVYHKAENREQWLNERDKYGYVKGGLAAG